MGWGGGNFLSRIPRGGGLPEEIVVFVHVLLATEEAAFTVARSQSLPKKTAPNPSVFFDDFCLLY